MPQSQRLLKPVPKRASTPLFLGAENVLLWLRPDSDTVTTGGSRTFTAANKSCFVGTTRITTRTAGVDFWLEFWFKPTNFTIDQILFSDGGFGLRGISVWPTVTTGTISYYLDAGDGTSVSSATTGTVTAGAWNHVVLTANRNGGGATGLIIYINGAVAGTRDISSLDAKDLSTSASYFPNVGRFVNNLFYYGGSVAHVRYGEGYVPTTSDVTWLYNNKNPRTYADLDELGGSLFSSLKRNYECNETSTSANLVDQHDLPGDGSNDLVRTHEELVKNGTFTTNLTGWSNGPANLWDTFEQAAGKMHLAQNGDSDPLFSIASQAVSVAIGDVYTYKFSVTKVSGTNLICDWADGANGTPGAGGYDVTKTDSDTVTATVTAALATVYLRFYSLNTTADEWNVDDVSVKATTIAVGNGPAEAIASDSVGTNHATLTGFSAAQLINAWVVDGDNYGLSLDGAANYLTLASAITSGTTWSFSCRIKLVAAPADKANLFATADGSAGLFINDDRKVNLYYGGDKLSTTALILDTWTYIGVSVSAGNATFYLNGVADGTTAGVTSISIARIGGDTASQFLSAVINDVRYYGATALTAEQFAELHSMDEDENSYGTGTGTATVTIPGLVAQWKFEDGPFGQPGEGDPLINWVSKEGDKRLLQQTTAGSRPTYHLSEVNGHPAVYFNGTSMFMSLGSAILSGVEGTVAFAVKFTDPTSCTILSSADTATATKYVALGTNGSDQMQVDQDETDVNTTIRGGTTLGTDWHILFFESNGSAYFLAIDDVDETLVATTGTNNGDWWDDSTGKDNTVLGALVTSGGTSLYFEGYIADIIVYKKCLSVAERTNLYKNYLKPRYL